MHQIDDLDNTDRKILRALQADARLTNSELGERIGLSASQCSRRRVRLEKLRLITGYHAAIDSERAGFGLVSILAISLATHNAQNASRLTSLLKSLPNVLEAFQVTGEMDYYIKVVTRDLSALSVFINTELLPHEAVQNVRTTIVLDKLKETAALPV